MAGRPRVYASNAERQAAYRRRALCQTLNSDRDDADDDLLAQVRRLWPEPPEPDAATLRCVLAMARDDAELDRHPLQAPRAVI